jgi:uncharacterized protein involved in type VI secretion and phage assembly
MKDAALFKAGVVVMRIVSSEFDGQSKTPPRKYGVYVARVTDFRDPESRGRVKIALPGMSDEDGGRFEAWARLATLFAGNNRGSWFVPEVDDEVLVAFDSGDPRHPFVIGSLWAGGNQVPAPIDGAGSNDRKIIRSRAGVQITLDDRPGHEELLLETPGGQTISLKGGDGTVEFTDGQGSSVRLDSSGVTITSQAKVTVQAGQVDIAAGVLRIDAGMARFSGVVQADTIISNSVVSASYTPGAGNIW